MFVLGIVGSIAGGKSTVSRYLQTPRPDGLGAVWIDADRIAKQALNRQDVVASLVEQFGGEILGGEILGGDRAIDRGRLSQLVFGTDPASRERLAKLEGVIHPIVRQMILDQLRELTLQNTPVVLLDIPLMFQSGWDRSCDQVWCVDASESIRRDRAASRGWDASELERRERNQTPIGEKRRLSNLVIENNGSLEQLYETLDLLWQPLAGTLKGGWSDDRHCR